VIKKFAKLGLNNVVEKVHLLEDNLAPDSKTGIEYLQKRYNHSNWKQSFTDGTRKNQAGKGMIYDEERDAFRAQTGAYPSWVLDEATCRFKCPVPFPEDGKTKKYGWNEDSTSWEEVV
jgi:hypothetical protein